MSDGNYMNRLPGFHFQNRYPVLANFGTCQKRQFKNTFYVLMNDTWIFKGETGRMDHMEGHDDTITCLAMALCIWFPVVKQKLLNVKNGLILSSYRMTNGSNIRGCYKTTVGLFS